MNGFTIIRSFFLVCTIYLAFIVNNSFSQLFTSQVVLSSLLLSFLLADLLSSGYKVVYENSPRFSFFTGVSILAFFLVLFYPVFLNYLVFFACLDIYNYMVSFLAIIFAVQDRLNPDFVSHVSGNDNWKLFEKRGLLFTSYRLEYSSPLFFISDFDKRSLYDIIKNNNATVYTSELPILRIGLFGKDLKFLSTSKNNLFKIASDIEKITVNLNIE